ncbi:hypothetical protein RRG08_011619 [Elysia crispata]|uniref:Uncharacterized protein n=1 Tax=Elysia crispata TaxID=231223 RepID=A0AAE0XP09_9GAST|nr:hypothetical protein RRG08_011619 [Elysia crispata]
MRGFNKPSIQGCRQPTRHGRLLGLAKNLRDGGSPPGQGNASSISKVSYLKDTYFGILYVFPVHNTDIDRWTWPIQTPRAGVLYPDLATQQKAIASGARIDSGSGAVRCGVCLYGGQHETVTLGSDLRVAASLELYNFSFLASAPKCISNNYKIRFFFYCENDIMSKKSQATFKLGLSRQNWRKPFFFWTRPSAPR